MSLCLMSKLMLALTEMLSILVFRLQILVSGFVASTPQLERTWAIERTCALEWVDGNTDTLLCTKGVMGPLNKPLPQRTSCWLLLLLLQVWSMLQRILMLSCPHYDGNCYGDFFMTAHCHYARWSPQGLFYAAYSPGILLKMILPARLSVARKFPIVLKH